MTSRKPSQSGIVRSGWVTDIVWPYLRSARFRSHLSLTACLLVIIVTSAFGWIGTFQRSLRYRPSITKTRVASAAISRHAVKTTYRITDIGPLSGHSVSWAEGINDAGQVAIVMLSSSKVRHSFLWKEGKLSP